jgi:hypothetical protein
MIRKPLTLEEHVELAKHTAAIYGHLCAMQDIMGGKVRVWFINHLLSVERRLHLFRMKLDNLLFEDHGLTNSLHLHSNSVEAKCTTTYRVGESLHDEQMKLWFK